MIIAMRTLYQKCKLLHGNLSEYNILYFEVSLYLFSKWNDCFFNGEQELSILTIVCQGHLYIIDVSQSVDLDHPHSLDFLREDCVHVSVSYIQ